MEDEEKIKVERFNIVDLRFWKIQIKDYLFKKDLHLSLDGRTHKPKEISDSEWEILDRKALGAN